MRVRKSFVNPVLGIAFRKFSPFSRSSRVYMIGYHKTLIGTHKIPLILCKAHAIHSPFSCMLKCYKIIKQNNTHQQSFLPFPFLPHLHIERACIHTAKKSLCMGLGRKNYKTIKIANSFVYRFMNFSPFFLLPFSLLLFIICQLNGCFLLHASHVFVNPYNKKIEWTSTQTLLPKRYLQILKIVNPKKKESPMR